MNRYDMKIHRAVLAILIAAILLSGVADAMSNCCAGVPGACVEGSGRDAGCAGKAAPGRGDCHEAPPPCCGDVPEQEGCAGKPETNGHASPGAFCCATDRCDTLRPEEFLQNAPPSFPAAVLNHEAAAPHAPDPREGAAADFHPPFFLSIPLYLLKQSLLC